MTKTVFVTIAGLPNVGKSSILNRFLGRKISIVTPKPQTTRTKIVGVLTKDGTQFVFTDVPGYCRPKNKLGEKMAKAAREGVKGADVCLFVTEPEGEIKETEIELLKLLKDGKIPAVLAVNKIDLVRRKSRPAEKIARFAAIFDFAAVVPVGALKNENVDVLLGELQKFAYESIHYFPDDALTDKPERVLTEEMIREKALLFLDKEVPHGLAVRVEKMSERPSGAIMDVEAVVYCEKESHKGIIIGGKGAVLKKILSAARIDAESFFGLKINLQCRVRVKNNWCDREDLIRSFGLD